MNLFKRDPEPDYGVVAEAHHNQDGTWTVRLVHGQGREVDDDKFSAFGDEHVEVLGNTKHLTPYNFASWLAEHGLNADADQVYRSTDLNEIWVNVTRA